MAFPFVAEFLFHAGFPLCHSGHLARAMQALERDGELPDPNEPNAEEWLADRLLEALAHLPVPTLLRALRGSAGPLVARAALEVLFTGGYEQLNHKLGDALREAFNSRIVHANAPRLNPPFLRLDAEIAALEIVCPAQNAGFVEAGRFGGRCDLGSLRAP